MTSKDDDTLPLPGFSEELSSDITADEDFIPTSQPQSSDGSKMSKNSETNFCKEEMKSDSRIDDTLPPEAVINHSILDNDKSTDFIPDTETKKPVLTYANRDLCCRKKLPVLRTEDLFKVQPKWNESEIPESPALETQNVSILNDTPTTVRPTKCEESVTEIIVNDSAETVDLEATSMKMRNSEGEGMGKLEISSSSNSDAERSEETQILDNSSVLLLDQPPTCRVSEKVESVGDLTTDMAGENGGNFQEKTEDLTPARTPLPASKKMTDSTDRATTNGHPMQEPNSVCTELNSTSVVTRKVDFKLTVSCLVTVNTKMNKVLQKIILNVNETPKSKPKPADLESDVTSDKSKRQSTSSSGSVYSDKMGPFALPKRLSAVSDQTDSSEEDFASHFNATGRRALERVPWSNEYLLPLKMDDMVLVSLENLEFIKRPNVMSPPKRVKSKHCNGVSHLKEILESSTSEQTSCSNLISEDRELNKDSQQDVSRTEQLDKQALEMSGPAPENKNSENPDKTTQDETTAEVGPDDQHKEQSTSEPSVTTERMQPTEPDQDKPDETSIALRPSLPVFARWTDKRYYSGVLCESLKNDRWDVKFDDGTSKAVREDFVMPAQWLQVGALVFAIVDDKYVSGQIVGVKKGEEEPTYVVELDTEKMEISVKLSDLCLTDVMAGIIREKYKPLGGTPRGKADIDFDNVLSGKRLREQRTPLRPVTTQSGNSGSRKKSSSKGKKDGSGGLELIKETPQNVEAEEKVGGLKTENGHLVEDRVISADSHSQSGAETGETPLRRNSKEARKRAKPRSLSYEGERSQGKKKTKNWLAPDGTPIPGPSGVKFKKQKTKPTTEKPVTPVGKNESAATKSAKKAPQSTEKWKKKRKLDESVDDGLQKSLREGEGRVRTRSRKG